MFTRKGMPKFARSEQVDQSPTRSQFAGESKQANGPPASAFDARPAHEPSRYPPPPVPDTTSIGKNFNLEGDNIVIRCKGTLSINGTVDADIHCEHLSIGDTARVTGSIAADEVSVHGKVEGVINGAQVTLHGNADVQADINSQFLSIERGAKFDGRSRRISDISQIAPQLMGSANDTDDAAASVHTHTDGNSNHVNAVAHTEHITSLEPVHTALDDDHAQTTYPANATHAHPADGNDEHEKFPSDVAISYPSNGTTS